MLASTLTHYLEEHHVPYRTIPHARTYTAQETAASAHVSGRELAKTVIVKLDGRLLMVVLPAHYHIDLHALCRVTGAYHAELADEQEFKDRFPSCEVGAMPPFGNLFDMEVLVARSLSEDEEIAFNAGSHTELIRMRFADFENLVHPTILDIAI